MYQNDMKVVTDFPGSRYPDLIVTRDPHDALDPLIKRHLKLSIEVLPQRTAEQDATGKLDEYQTIPELDEYVLIDSRKRSVRIYRRHGDQMSAGPAIISGGISLQSLNLTITLDDIYEDVDFDAMVGRCSVGALAERIVSLGVVYERSRGGGIVSCLQPLIRCAGAPPASAGVRRENNGVRR
ncbi:MAG: Uma2 family endonuclease [Vulcanimicrobiaceae bacterium]